MIDAKELRIGNYIQLRNKFVMAGGIPNIHKLLIPGEQYAVEVEEFVPIPLTEDLLLKCGFKKINHISGYSFFSMERKKSGVNIDIYEAYSTIGGNTSVPHIQFLHQLQNLYFALTGKELEVTL